MEMINPFLSVDLLIDQLQLLKKMYAEKGIRDLRVAISVSGENGFTTPFIETFLPMKIDAAEGDYVILLARKNEPNVEIFSILGLLHGDAAVEDAKKQIHECQTLTV